MTDYEMIQLITEHFDKRIKHLATQAHVVEIKKTLEIHLDQHDDEKKRLQNLKVAVLGAFLSGGAALVVALLVKFSQ